MKLPAGEVFARGELQNSEGGLYMTDKTKGRMLKWFAMKGKADDWCIYCGWECYSNWWFLRHGDKVTHKIHINRCVPCDDEVFTRYRY